MQPGSTRKVVDDYHAKIRMWAERQEVIPPAPVRSLPKFKAQRFRSHAEMNAWKADYLLRIAAESNG